MEACLPCQRVDLLLRAAVRSAGAAALCCQPRTCIHLQHGEHMQDAQQRRPYSTALRLETCMP